MIRRCALTEMAAKLSLQLETYSIPDDFDATGNDGQVIERIRDRYTNYHKLAAELPPCPDNCPPAHSTTVPANGHCLTYEFAHHLLKNEAKQVALAAYRTWSARQRGNKAASLWKTGPARA